VALRPIRPVLPFDLPNSIRPLNPALPTTGEFSTIGFNNVGADGNPTTAIQNQLVNYGWEYVWHCHILSHEEMDMMRPQSLALPPAKPTGVVLTPTWAGADTTVTVDWTDNSINETGFVAERSSDGTTWETACTVDSPLGSANVKDAVLSCTDTTVGSAAGMYSYRVVAQNRVGYGGEFMGLTVQSVSDTVPVPPAPPTAVVDPTRLLFGDVPVPGSATLTVTLSNVGTGNLNSTFSVIGIDSTYFSQTNACGTVAPGASCQISVTFTVPDGGDRQARLRISSNDPVNGTLDVPLRGNGVLSPAAPSNLTGTGVRVGTTQTYDITLNWTDNSTNENGFRIDRAPLNNNNPAACDFAARVWGNVGNVGTDVTTFVDLGAPRAGNLCYRVQAFNASGSSAWSNTWLQLTP
jgi:hypothetical protein